MAPTKTTVDYYLLLEVSQTATSETITKSYKRLALLHHPDRSKRHDATQVFQQIGAAYETLKDETKRREYDLIYPTIKRSSTTSSEKTKPPPTSEKAKPPPTAQPPLNQDSITLARIVKEQAERRNRWALTEKRYNGRIAELKKKIEELQKGIKEFDDKDKAEDAEEAAAKSWSTWFLSPVYKRGVLTEEEKESRARERLQRLHSRGFKQRDLEKFEKELKGVKFECETDKQSFEFLNRRDENSKSTIEERIRKVREREQEERDRVAREARAKEWREQQERDRVAREAREKAWREQQERDRVLREAREKALREELEKRRREAAKVEKERKERVAKQFAEQQKELAAEAERRRKILEEYMRGQDQDVPKWKRNTGSRAGTGAGHTSTTKASCSHEGWWPKVQRRDNCQRCSGSFGYLLQCPGCAMKTCASCRAAIKPSRGNGSKMKAGQGSRAWRSAQRNPNPGPSMSYTHFEMNYDEEDWQPDYTEYSEGPEYRDYDYYD